MESTLPAVWSALFEASGYSGPSVQAAMVHIARHDPARVLNLVAAVRAIVDLAETETARAESSMAAVANQIDAGIEPGIATLTSNAGTDKRAAGLRHVLTHLAAIWDWHDDYDPAWAPEGE